MIHHLYFKLSVFLVLLIISSCLAKFYILPEENKLSSQRTVFHLFLLLTVTFLVRLPYIVDVELNIDTSTWLSSVIAINHYPNQLWTFLNYTDSRPLTVLPLLILSFLGVHTGYYVSECVGIIFWLGSVFFLFKTMNLFLAKQASLVICWGLCLLIATMYLSDYTSYNSEQVGILMLSVAVYGYAGYLKKIRNSDLLMLGTGFILGNLPFVKFQNVPMGLLIAGFFLFEIINRKEWKKALLFITGGILPTLLINIYYISQGKLEIFWNNYFWNYFYYSYTTQFSSVPVGERFNPIRVAKFIYNSQNSRVYLLTVTTLIIACLTVGYKSVFSAKNPVRTVLLFGFLFILVSLYSLFQSGNSFQHYRLYLFIPLTLFFGLLTGILSAKRQKLMLLIFLSLCMLTAGINMLARPESVDMSHADLDHKIVQSIKANSSEKDPIVIWGWRDQLYVHANRPMGYRDAHTFHFSLKSELIPSWTADLLNDMKTNQPRLFIDATQPEDYSIFSKILIAHEKVPAVGQYISRHYHLIETIDGARIYKRNN